MGKTIAELVMTVIVFALFGQPSKPPSPALTEAQKLEIRNAQVEYFGAKAVLENSAAYQALQNTQAKLNETVRRIQKDTGCEPPKFQLGGDLSCTAVPQPTPAPKVEPPKQ